MTEYMNPINTLYFFIAALLLWILEASLWRRVIGMNDENQEEKSNYSNHGGLSKLFFITVAVCAWFCLFSVFTWGKSIGLNLVIFALMAVASHPIVQIRDKKFKTSLILKRFTHLLIGGFLSILVSTFFIVFH